MKWLKPLAVHLTQKLGRSAHLLSATIIQMAPPVHSFFTEHRLINRLFMSSWIHYRDISQTAIFKHSCWIFVKKGQNLSQLLLWAFFYDYGSRARVIARTIKVIKGWSCSLGSFFSFSPAVWMCLCVCVCVWGCFWVFFPSRIVQIYGYKMHVPMAHIINLAREQTQKDLKHHRNTKIPWRRDLWLD